MTTRDEERLRQAVQRFVRGFGLLSDITPSGDPLPSAEAHLLQILYENREPPTQGQLATLLGVDKSTLTRLLQRLAAQRRVTRYADISDGRVRRVALTQPGRQLAHELVAASRRRFAMLLETVPEARRPPVIDALEQLASVLQGDSYPKATPPRPRPRPPARGRRRR